jgi:hypothetical protein
MLYKLHMLSIKSILGDYPNYYELMVTAQFTVDFHILPSHSDILSVPQDLRTVLEQLLAEEASPTNLDRYLPRVRQIITGLLAGIRSKQSMYRKMGSP